MTELNQGNMLLPTINMQTMHYNFLAGNIIFSACEDFT